MTDEVLSAQCCYYLRELGASSGTGVHFKEVPRLQRWLLRLGTPRLRAGLNCAAATNIGAQRWACKESQSTARNGSATKRKTYLSC
jgi:hypothetical protein